jgi:hypothetical protein
MSSPSGGDSFRSKVYLAIIVAALSFSGGAGGTLMASYFEKSKWQRETEFSIKRETFAKRMELLERTIKAINNLQVIDIYEASGRYSFIEGEDLIRSGKVAAPALATVVEGVVKLKETQAELSAVMSLDAIYFGPRTKRALIDLQKALGTAQPWWRLADSKTKALLDAMAGELEYDLM